MKHRLIAEQVDQPRRKRNQGIENAIFHFLTPLAGCLAVSSLKSKVLQACCIVFRNIGYNGEVDKLIEVEDRLMSKKQGKVEGDLPALGNRFPLAANVSELDKESFKLTVRSLTPKVSNMIFTKRRNGFIQIDFSYVELDFCVNESSQDKSEQQISLQDKNVLPHTTIMLSQDAALSLLSELSAAIQADVPDLASSTP